MGFKEFDQGIPSSRLEKWRQQEASEQLSRQMQARWKESERIQGILRLAGSSPKATPEVITDWFSTVKSQAALLCHAEQQQPWTPNSWFAELFPEARNRYGNAFFEDVSVDSQRRQVTTPSVINEDFFAAILEGERRLGHRIVYLPAEGFWFKDTKLDAFCPTTDKKVEILLSNYLLKCAENMGANVASKVLFLDHRRPSVLAGIVQRAKAVLEADPRFFEGANAPKRVSNGRILEPSMPSSPENFIHSTFVPKEGGVVIVSEAYQKFLGHCQRENLTRVEFTEFKRVARELVMEKFQLGLRHDIRTPEGRQTHGWKHIRLLSDSPAQVGEAA